MTTRTTRSTPAISHKPSPENVGAAVKPPRVENLEPVAQAVDFLVRHAAQAPSLDETARAAGLSPAHFQRLFKTGVGVSPKRFLQYMAAGRAKAALSSGAPLLDAALEAGLSGPSRLHDLILASEAMTPGAFKKRGEGLLIRHAIASSPFGGALIGATDHGICWLAFADPENGGFDEARRQMMTDWAAAVFVEDAAFIQPLADQAFRVARGKRAGAPVKLHVRGTNFQLKVWEALLSIPFGQTKTYGDVARAVDAPKAARAVGSAVGANLISVLIPCHRVVRASGALYNYRWGGARKRALLALEAAISAPSSSVSG